MRNVALDLGRRISYCEVSSGEVVARKTVLGVEHLEGLLGKELPAARVAIEACREAWAIADWLEARGHKVLLVDTTRVRALGIGHHNRKTDRIDAETLARAVERDQIPRAHLLSKPRQALRLQLGVRRALMETRTKYIVTIRHLLKAAGVRLPKWDADDFVSKLESVSLSDANRQLLSPLLDVLKALGPQLAKADFELERLVDREPIAQKLQTVPGVGPIIAAAFISVVDGPKRFKKAHQLESYLGLVPSEFTSGKRQLGAITKRGNAYLRSLLAQGSWNILRRKEASFEPLVAWAQLVAGRRGKKIAVMAISRKLAGILWALWRDDAAYDPKRAGLESAAGIGRQADQRIAAAETIERAAMAAEVTRSPVTGEVPPTA